MLELDQVLISTLVRRLSGKLTRKVSFAEDGTLTVFAKSYVDRDFAKLLL